MRCAPLLVVVLLTCACGGAPQSRNSGAAPSADPVAVIALPRPSGGASAATAVPVVTLDTSPAQARIDMPGVSQPADELTAELEDTASGEVRRWPVDATAGGVSITVPIYAVAAGEHLLTLWQGDADAVARYRFRVATP